MIRRFWVSREGGLSKATLAISGALFLAASTVTGMAVLFDVIAGAVR